MGYLEVVKITSNKKKKQTKPCHENFCHSNVPIYSNPSNLTAWERSRRTSSIRVTSINCIRDNYRSVMWQFAYKLFPRRISTQPSRSNSMESDSAKRKTITSISRHFQTSPGVSSIAWINFHRNSRSCTLKIVIVGPDDGPLDAKHKSIRSQSIFLAVINRGGVYNRWRGKVIFSSPLKRVILCNKFSCYQNSIKATLSRLQSNLEAFKSR